MTDVTREQYKEWNMWAPLQSHRLVICAFTGQLTVKESLCEWESFYPFVADLGFSFWVGSNSGTV